MPTGTSTFALLADLLSGDPDIGGYAAATLDTVRIDDENVPLLPVQPLTAELWPTVTEGRVPAADDEILVGADVLAAIDAAVGDEVVLEEPYAPSGEGREYRRDHRGRGRLPCHRDGRDRPDPARIRCRHHLRRVAHPRR